MKTLATTITSLSVLVSTVFTHLPAEPGILQLRENTQVTVTATATTLPTPMLRAPRQQIIVGNAIAGDTSLPLRDLVADTTTTTLTTRPLLHPRSISGRTTTALSPSTRPADNNPDAVSVMPTPSRSFEGMSNLDGFVPADPNGAVGRTYYVQAVNMHFAVFNKTTGAIAYGPVSINTLWSGFGGACATYNRGDPIVLYDQLADRWIISQFAYPSYDGPFLQCFAISTTDDPTGIWNRYAFQMPNNTFNDYTKIALWPNAYFMTTNQFTSSATVSAGVGVWALNRAQILAGVVSPTYVFVDVGATNANYSSLLPANLDGNILPPNGSPGYFAAVDQASNTNGWPNDALRLWQLKVDWANPISATFGLANEPNAVLPVTPYSVVPCTGFYGNNCIPQPVSPKVDAVGDRLMFRLVYRNFGDHEALVANHTVQAGTGVAGVRWYEVRNPGGQPSIYQQGTYAPDSVYRWMGSIAFDRAGNIAVGYSASSSSVFPSIRYAGRLAGDPLGDLTQGEQSLMDGAGGQTSGFARWGDYSAMSVDPTDDCTFWYTNQYYATTAISNWQTRIGAFRFPTCGTGWLTGTVTELQTGLPISGAMVSAVTAAGIATNTTTSAGGAYSLMLFSNTYTVTASDYYHPPTSSNQISVTAGNTTTQDIALNRANQFSVTGVVTDIVSGIPLHARVNVAGSSFNPPILFTTTDASGNYTLTLAGGQAYTLTVTSDFKPSQMRGIGVLSADRVENFALWRQLLLVTVLRQ